MPDEPVFNVSEKLYKTLVDRYQEGEEQDSKVQPALEDQQEPKSQKLTDKNGSAEEDANSAE